MSAIAAYRTAILALLMDASNAIFSTNDIDQALRWAMSEMSLKRPIIRTYMFTVIATTGIHIMPADFITRNVSRVELYDSDPDAITELNHHAELIDESWVIQTENEVQAGEVLQISYADVYQVDGLDSASGTTVPDQDETTLQVGAAGYAAQMRANDRIETINMNPKVSETYRLLGTTFLRRFYEFLFPSPGVEIASPSYPEMSF